MQSMLPTARTILIQFHTAGIIPPVFFRQIVSLFALCTG